jgi:hypothetical protein
MSSDLLVIAAIGAGLYFLSPGATTAAVDAAAKAAGTIAEAAGSVIDISRKGVEEVSKAIENTVEVGIGVPLVFEGCRDGFRNDGLTCFKDGGIRTYECGRLRGAFGEDWGPKLCTDTWAPESYSQKLVCKEGRVNVDSLCYKPCPPGSGRVPGMPYLCRY